MCKSSRKEKPVGLSGRPWKFTSVPKLEAAIEAYFSKCEEKAWAPTMAGLALSLDLSTETLRNYKKDLLFGSTIARAKQRIEAFWERLLMTAKGTGVQFNLKNNFGWKDKSEQEITGAGGGALVTKIVVDYGDDTDDTDD